MKNTEQGKPDEYFVINPDGTESILHVDYFTNPPVRSKNPQRIQIIHVSDVVSHKSFQEELQQFLADDKVINFLSFKTKH